MKKSLAHSLLSLLLCLLFVQQAKAQDPQYSQFYSNLLMLNPAFAGSGIGPRIAMNYRAQWVRIPGAYQQGAFSFDQPLFIGRTTQGYGIHLSYDRAGEGNLTKLDLIANYAYQVDLTDVHKLRFGVGAGFQQASIDFFKLRFPDQIDPRDGVVFPTQEPGAAAGLNEVQLRPDFHAGLTYFNEYAWLGFTVNHLTEPLQRFYDPDLTPLRPDINANLPRKYTVTGGIRLPIGPYNDPDRITLTPAFLVKVQGQFSQVDAGLYLNIDPMVFGLWYRNQDALIGLVGLQKGNFSIGYSFDYTISELTQSISGGSHEIAIVMEIEQFRKLRRMKHQDVPCPRF
jgi:type IX secretion system PorP/SprF family membrane protein